MEEKHRVYCQVWRGPSYGGNGPKGKDDREILGYTLSGEKIPIEKLERPDDDVEEGESYFCFVAEEKFAAITDSPGGIYTEVWQKDGKEIPRQARHKELPESAEKDRALAGVQQ